MARLNPIPSPAWSLRARPNLQTDIPIDWNRFRYLKGPGSSILQFEYNSLSQRSGNRPGSIRTVSVEPAVFPNHRSWLLKRGLLPRISPDRSRPEPGRFLWVSRSLICRSTIKLLLNSYHVPMPLFTGPDTLILTDEAGWYQGDFTRIPDTAMDSGAAIPSINVRPARCIRLRGSPPART